jgi:hypothetical protein
LMHSKKLAVDTLSVFTDSTAAPRLRNLSPNV